MNKKPIIFIDDDPEDIDVLKEVMHEMHLDHPVISFTDPVKALLFFQDKQAIDVFFILCDLNMPTINGLQLRKEMIGYAGYDAGTPFYLLSTGNVATNKDATIGLNITDYLIKPSSYTGIKEALAVIIQHTRDLIK